MLHPSDSSKAAAEHSKPSQPSGNVQTEESRKQDLVGDDATNEQKAPATPEPQSTNDTPMSEIRPKGAEKGHERRVSNDDHGGEELVEGQEDDVIY